MKTHEEVAAPVSEREAAEDGILDAIEGLTVPVALGALTEVQAQISADHGILPDTPAFEADAAIATAMLAGRVGTIARQRAGTAPVIEHDEIELDEIEGEAEAPAPFERGPMAWLRRAWHCLR